MGATAMGLQALAFLLSAPAADAGAQYERAASTYAGFRRLWLRVAGAPAEHAMLAELRRTLRPGDRVLDAGCGTGAIARTVHATEPTAEITMLDRSAAMLAAGADVPGRRLLGSILELPFADRSFDIVVAAWVLETISDQEKALEELARVLAPGGILLLTFCSRPPGRIAAAVSAPIRYAVSRWFAATFAIAGERPIGASSGATVATFRGGLVAIASYTRPASSLTDSRGHLETPSADGQETIASVDEQRSERSVR